MATKDRFSLTFPMKDLERAWGASYGNVPTLLETYCFTCPAGQQIAVASPPDELRQGPAGRVRKRASLLDPIEVVAATRSIDQAWEAPVQACSGRKWNGGAPYHLAMISFRSNNSRYVFSRLQSARLRSTI
jgi:hypothetical protein